MHHNNNNQYTHKPIKARMLNEFLQHLTPSNRGYTSIIISSNKRQPQRVIILLDLMFRVPTPYNSHEKSQNGEDNNVEDILLGWSALLEQGYMDT